MKTPIYRLLKGFGFLAVWAALGLLDAQAQPRRGAMPLTPVGAPETFDDIRRDNEARAQQDLSEAQNNYRLAQLELGQQLDARAENLLGVVSRALVWDGHHWTVPRYYVQQIDCVSTLEGLRGRDRVFVSPVRGVVCQGGYLSQTARSEIRYSAVEQRLRSQVTEKERERDQIQAEVAHIEETEEARPWYYRALENAENELVAARTALDQASPQLEVDRRLVTCVARYPGGFRVERCRTARLGDLVSNRR